jgi:hypothetical protein
MIENYRCTRCKISYELSYDDNEDAYYSGVEDTDNDYAEIPEPEYCPFCGEHLMFDSDEDDDF